MKTIAAILFAALIVSAEAFQPFRIAWDSADGSTNVTYALYAHTNAMTQANFRQAPYRLAVGTNTSVTVENLISGYTWYFGVTYFSTNGMESDLSAPIQLTALPVPGAIKIVNIPYVTQPTNGVYELNFFRVRVQ